MKYSFSNIFLYFWLINPSLLVISCFALEKAKKNLLKASPLTSKWELEKMINCNCFFELEGLDLTLFSCLCGLLEMSISPLSA